LGENSNLGYDKMIFIPIYMSYNTSKKNFFITESETRKLFLFRILAITAFIYNLIRVVNYQICSLRPSYFSGFSKSKVVKWTGNVTTGGTGAGGGGQSDSGKTLDSIP